MRHLILDTETTDLLGPRQLKLESQPHITEFYGQVVVISGNQWTTIRELEFRCRPGGPISAEASRITGLTNLMLEAEPPFRAFWHEIVDLMGDADVVVAHNLSFDLQMLEVEATRIDQKVPWPERKVCTIEATEYLKGFRLDLNSLHEYLFKEPFAGAHRAKVDVQALTRCYVELVYRGIV